MAERTTTAASPQDQTSPRRTGYRISNMLIALGFMLVVILLAVLIVPRRHFDAVKVVPTADVIRSAEQVAPYDVVVPEGLPARWRPTSIRLTTPDKPGDPTTLEIGYVTPSDEYAALIESDERASTLIRIDTQRARPDGVQWVNTLLWDKRYQTDRGVRSLVRRVGNATVIVTGTGTYDELAELAASLR